MVQKRMKILLAIGLMLLILLSAAVSIGAQENDINTNDSTKVQVAPPNPAFLEYRELLEQGRWPLYTQEGYPLGYIPPPVQRPREKDPEIVHHSGLPAAFDLRATGRITPVRDQGLFGSCWAFATYASLESYLKPRSVNNFSENNLMRLHGFDWGPDDGGNEFISMAYLTRWSGPVKEADDPYPTDPANPGLKAERHVQRVDFISETPAEIKKTIMSNGAVYTAMHWAPAYYNPTTSSYFYFGFDWPNHAVTIVGWNDNYSRFNFNMWPPGDGAWIIKNSWGTSWGDNGYFYMSYYDYWAGAYPTAFHNAELTFNYDRNYQYDPLGWVSSLGYPDYDHIHAANIFSAVADEYLVAVGTYAPDFNTPYEIRIHTNVDINEPESGMLELSQNGTIARPGYITIDLEDAVPLNAGERFAVIVRFSTPGWEYPAPIEYVYPGYSSGATANIGESFVRLDNMPQNEWDDLTLVFDPTANVCIKAYTRTFVWRQLTRSTAQALGYGDMTGDGNKNLVAAIPSGTWYIDGDDWVRMTTSRARTITFADVTGDGDENFVAGLHSGTWYLDGGDWHQLTRSTAHASGYGDMSGDGEKNLVLSIPSGIWYIDEGDWVRVTTSRAQTITFADVTGDGEENFVAGLHSGTWYLDGGIWHQLTPSTATASGCGDMNVNGEKNLLLSVPTGIWYIDGGDWVRVTTSTARTITFADATGDGEENFVAGLLSGTWYLD